MREASRIAGTGLAAGRWIEANRLRGVVWLLSAGLLFLGVAAASGEEGKAFLLHLNGIGGERMCDHTLVDGLREGGFRAEVEFYDWTGGRIGIEALQGRDRHEKEAKKIAEKLTAQHRAHPDVPIYVTSHSGGCGLAVWALELLPDDVQVECLLMFAPALSPDYDLSKAFRHVKRKAYAFTSKYDTIVLGTGTKMFGTIDGQRVEAAGLRGFVRPDAADAEEYKKMETHAYRAAWLGQYGSAGSHICALRKKFAREYVARLLLTGEAPKDRELNLGATTRPGEVMP